MSKPKPVKVFQDVNGKYHENQTECEIINLAHALDIELNSPSTNELIEQAIGVGDKAKRLKKLLTGK